MKEKNEDKYREQWAIYVGLGLRSYSLFIAFTDLWDYSVMMIVITCIIEKDLW